MIDSGGCPNSGLNLGQRWTEDDKWKYLLFESDIQRNI
jgi:hypothetical protein